MCPQCYNFHYSQPLTGLSLVINFSFVLIVLIFVIVYPDRQAKNYIFFNNIPFPLYFGKLSLVIIYPGILQMLAAVDLEVRTH